MKENSSTAGINDDYNKVEKNNSRQMDYSTSFKCYGDACKNVWIVIKKLRSILFIDW